jgi:pyruvate kinase
VDDPDIMKKLIETGMNVARMNFSHGSHDEHLARLTQLRKICKEINKTVAVLLDTKGPEIRLGVFEEKAVELKENQSYILTTKAVNCDNTRASISYKGLPRDVAVGNNILIDDGLVCLRVTEITSDEIICTVVNGGVISSRKSVNVPDVKLCLPSLTEQDKKDILFAIEHDYDFIAVSFVRKREDILAIRRILEENGGANIQLIAKIENREGVENLDEILRVSDGVMVARGDLGVELPVEEIPAVQKLMIRRCYQSGKPVITATQMLDSMIRNPRPTRAEANDVANAIYDGTSAIMLSGETASGKYPVEALETMIKIAQTTEQSIHYWNRLKMRPLGDTSSITNAISHATCTTAMDLNAEAIVAVTTSGKTARKISSFRPLCPIIATTTSKKVFNQLHMSWGVRPVLTDVVSSTDDLFDIAAESARDTGLVRNGDLVVITAGVPVGMSGTTNMLKVQMIGNTLCKGKGYGILNATAQLCIINRGGEINSGFSRGDILVIDEITDDILPLIRLASGVILAGEDKDDKAATLSKALEIPVISEADGAVYLLKAGTVVHMDAKRGVVECAE